jgi:hypothetical protein
MLRIAGRNAAPRPGHANSPSWPGLFRPSTSYDCRSKKDVDARDKPGHDGRPRGNHASTAILVGVARDRVRLGVIIIIAAVGATSSPRSSTPGYMPLYIFAQCPVDTCLITLIGGLTLEPGDHIGVEAKR